MPSGEKLGNHIARVIGVSGRTEHFSVVAHGTYCNERVMRLRLRLLSISLFILVLPRFPVLAWPCRVILQFFMFPCMI